MGCFMGCFGLSSNKKRRNSIRKILPRDQRICSYEPLHSSDTTDFTTVLHNPEDKISTSNLSFVEEEKKKTRKTVRFNLNVQTYEPILQENDDFSVDEMGKGERSKGSSSVIDKKKPEDSSSISVYPSNYRYHSCVDSFEEEEDEIGYGESDLDDEDYYTDEENDYEDDADDEDEEDEVFEVTPLLNPVENLAQWKAVKAKPVRVKQIMKENVVEADNTDEDDQEKPLLKEIIVNTSLSNWVASTTKRSPIVDITNMENRLHVSQ
ncbi:hypothetical protein AALP_AA6G061800 [Arabis alpina]|uniref:Uncharacterized protein n=1 Tax=Arabis alpina TaxID=50452 RepID=A0A087GME7_ARAAL|nr:hypothetical protein AALP_AA6G061800 [Arabis alpina]